VLYLKNIFIFTVIVLLQAIGMPYVALGNNKFDCTVCHTRCDGISKGMYLFDNDALFSAHYEQRIIEKINRKPGFTAAKNTTHSYPDIVIHNNNGQVYRYLEVKVQQRTFMSIQKKLPNSNLLPSETVALNLSDLLRYFKIESETGVPTVIVWVLLHRPCIVGQGGENMYFQAAVVLKNIFEIEGNRRRFRRLSGKGDVVEGVHKGVTVNYHFSLNELMHWP